MICSIHPNVERATHSIAISWLVALHLMDSGAGRISVAGHTCNFFTFVEGIGAMSTAPKADDGKRTRTKRAVIMVAEVNDGAPRRLFESLPRASAGWAIMARPKERDVGNFIAANVMILFVMRTAYEEKPGVTLNGRVDG